MLVTSEHIEMATRAICSGELVAFPTETVYGLGANALDAMAVARIFELKQRPRFDPLIVHIASAGDLPPLVERVPELAQQLIEKFWPGPLSVVLPKKPRVPDIVTAGLMSVAIRCPAHEVAQALIRCAGVPVAAPSANVFGAVSPTTAEHVRQQFGDRLPHILDAGPCSVGVESTVVSFVNDKPLLLRPGGVTREEIERVIGAVELGRTGNAQPVSPGQLSRHYSPATRLVLTNEEIDLQSSGRVGLLTFQAPSSRAGFTAVEVLSEEGCLHEAAANLFAAMRRLDVPGLDLIVARPLPEAGLGAAIMDRLRRAAAK